MAPVTRASKPKPEPEPEPTPMPTPKGAARRTKKADIPLQSVEGRNGVSRRSQQRKSRSKAYKRKKRQQALAALSTLAGDPEQPLAAAQRDAARADFYRPWRHRSGRPKRAKELEQLVVRQKEEIEQLKKQAGSRAEQGQDQDQSRNPDVAAPEAGGGRGGRGGRRTRRGLA